MYRWTTRVVFKWCCNPICNDLHRLWCLLRDYNELTCKSIEAWSVGSGHVDIWAGAPNAPLCGHIMVYMLGNCVCKSILYGLRLMCIDMCMADEVVGERGAVAMFVYVLKRKWHVTWWKNAIKCCKGVVLSAGHGGVPPINSHVAWWVRVYIQNLLGCEHEHCVGLWLHLFSWKMRPCILRMWSKGSNLFAW